MQKCPFCGKINPGEHTRCSHCGNPFRVISSTNHPFILGDPPSNIPPPGSPPEENNAIFDKKKKKYLTF